jgi:hypothetical protein
MAASNDGKKVMLQNITGIGDLNLSHLARVVSHATGSPSLGVENVGSNTNFVQSLLGHGLKKTQQTLTATWRFQQYLFLLSGSSNSSGSFLFCPTTTVPTSVS